MASTVAAKSDATTTLTSLYLESVTVGAVSGTLLPTKLGYGAQDSLTLVTTTTGLPVQQQTGATFAVTGTFYQATQPVSVTSVPSHDVTNAGTFAVQAAQSGTWNVGTVTTVTGITNTVTVTGTGGTFPVTDSGGSLTVDAPVGTPVFVRLSDGSAAITTLPVSLASVPSHAVTNAGTFVVQVDGSALTSLQLLDDAVYVDDADWTDDTSKHLLVGGVYQAAPHTVTDGDVTPFLTDSNGRLSVSVNGTVTVASHAVTNAGTFAVQAAQSGTWNVGTVTSITNTVTVTGTGGTFPVTDSGGSLTVDAPVGTPVFVRLSDGSAAISTLPVSLASVPSHAVTNAGTFAVQVDGIALTSLQLIDDAVYADDAAWTGDSSKHALVGGIYQSSPQTVTDGRTAPILLDANGKVQVAAHAVTQSGTWNITNVSGTVSLPTGAATAANQSTANTALSGIQTAVEVIDNAISGSEMQVDVVAALPAGTNAIGKLAANSGVDIGDVDVLSVIPGTGATNLGKAIDTATGGTDTGVLLLATRDDALSALTPIEGDNVQVRVDANGALWVIVSGTVTVASHAVTNAGTFVVQVDGTAITRLTDIETNTDSGAVVGNGAAATAQRVSLANDSTGVLATVSTVTTLANGQTAHDSAISGSPLRIGARAETALSGITLVADGDATDLHAGVDGVLITRPHCNLEDLVSGVASNTDGASTEVIATAGAGIKQYLTSCTLVNTSASMIYVEIKSGATVRWRFPVPATGGVTHNWDPPLAPNAANEAWNMDGSAAATTLYGSAAGFKSKV